MSETNKLVLHCPACKDGELEFDPDRVISSLAKPCKCNQCGATYTIFFGYGLATI
jgi:uncharacterized protein YbaR (Trm112 family)